MAWGIHWATSAPGPIADMPWLRQVVRYVDTLPDRGRYVIGSPLYGMDWPRDAGPGPPARAHGYGIGVWRLGREDQALWSDPLLAR
jgi:spore germination protein YaaH